MNETEQRAALRSVGWTDDEIDTMIADRTNPYPGETPDQNMLRALGVPLAIRDEIRYRGSLQMPSVQVNHRRTHE